MNREQFLRRMRRYARRNGLEYRFESRRGKGSHGTIHLGGRDTIVPEGEIRKGTLSAILKQLGIEQRRF